LWRDIGTCQLPSYDEWPGSLEATAITLLAPGPRSLPVCCTVLYWMSLCCFSRHIYLYFSQWFVTQGYPWKPEYANETGVDAKGEQVVPFPDDWSDGHSNRKESEVSLENERARKYQEMYSLGANFMFGMFFHGSLPWLKNR
jgi:hypothetical protein